MSPARAEPLSLLRPGLIAWLGLTVAAFIAAELVTSQALPNPRAAAVAGVGLRVVALLATLAAVARTAVTTREEQEQLLRARDVAAAEQVHEARSALAAIEHAARALPPAAAPITLQEAIVTEVALLRRLLGGRTASDAPFAVADAVAPAVTSAVAAGAAVHVDLGDGLTARGDAIALTQVVQALLDNAQRHAPGSPITVAGAQEQGRLRLAVSDTGPGIAADLLPHVTDPGVRGEASGGSGLGLAVADRLIRGMGGTLHVASVPGAGSRFEIDLPSMVGAAER